MLDLIYVAIIIIDIVVIKDILKKLEGSTERFLWVICVLFLPVIGALYWYQVQYVESSRRKELRQDRRYKDVKEVKGEKKL